MQITQEDEKEITSRKKKKKQRTNLRLVIVTFYMYILFTLQEENVRQAHITFCLQHLNLLKSFNLQLCWEASFEAHDLSQKHLYNSITNQPSEGQPMGVVSQSHYSVVSVEVSHQNTPLLREFCTSPGLTRGQPCCP